MVGEDLKPGIHEFIALHSEAAALGFMLPVLAQMAQVKKPIVWVSGKHRLYPPGLTEFGLLPEQFLFVQVADNQEALWVLEKTLKTAPVSAVIGENIRLNLVTARRLHLSAGQSGNRLLLLHTEGLPAVCHIAMTRWQVSPFKIELVRCRNGQAPKMWNIEWHEQKVGFNLVSEPERQFGRVMPEGEEVYARYGTG